MRFIIFIFCILKLSNAMVLNCTFENHDTVYDTTYTCIVKNFHTSLKDRKVTEVFGDHRFGKTNEDVRQVFMKHQNVPYLPLNLGEFFPNLQTLYIMKSNVQHLMTGDLDGLDKLKIFDVSHNPVERIGEDFFKGHSSIEKLSFYDCHIKLVDKGALDGLSHLRAMYFDQNPCIDLRFNSENYYETVGDITESIADLYDKCQGMNHSLRSNDTECHALKNEKIISPNDDETQEKSSNMLSTVLIILLAFTMLLNIIFGVLLVRIFKNNFGGSWHEMKNVLV